MNEFNYLVEEKTMLDKFKEIFPNAVFTENGTPKDICPHGLGWCEEFSLNDCLGNTALPSCEKCWNRPYDEKYKTKGENK